MSDLRSEQWPYSFQASFMLSTKLKEFAWKQGLVPFIVPTVSFFISESSINIESGTFVWDKELMEKDNTGPTLDKWVYIFSIFQFFTLVQITVGFYNNKEETLENMGAPGRNWCAKCRKQSWKNTEY